MGDCTLQTSSLRTPLMAGTSLARSVNLDVFDPSICVVAITHSVGVRIADLKTKTKYYFKQNFRAFDLNILEYEI